ncbi:MAG: DMT family transporter [Alphaproteobacteria bacterium]
MAEAAKLQGESEGTAGNLKGIGWMLLSGFLFVGVTGIVRHLGSDMSPIQAAFIRYAFGLVLVSPLLLRLAGGAWLFSGGRARRRRLGLHALRGLIHGIGVMLWFYAMARIPIAEVTALGFIAPIFTTLGAALFLGERLRARRLGAVLVAFGGAMIILRPGFHEISAGALAQLAAAPLFVASFLIAKKLTETETSPSIVAHMAIFVTLALLPGAIIEWRTPTPLRRDLGGPAFHLPATGLCDAARLLRLRRAAGDLDLARRRGDCGVCELHRPPRSPDAAIPTQRRNLTQTKKPRQKMAGAGSVFSLFPEPNASGTGVGKLEAGGGKCPGPVSSLIWWRIREGPDRSVYCGLTGVTG